MTPPAPRALVFTDLDGTLLDHQSYSSAAAEPGLEDLRSWAIPLVVSTSKTFAELTSLDPRALTAGVAVVENGAATVWGVTDKSPEILAVGADYATLRVAFEQLRRNLDLPLVGFGDVDAAAIAAQTGLDKMAAANSRKRSGDEPFWSERDLAPGDVKRLLQAARARGFSITRGGRFFHLTGDADKGTAARRVIERLLPDRSRARTAAFGDAANDRSLLAAVTVPFAVRRPDGSVDPALASLPGIHITEGIGPIGFCQGVTSLLEEWADLDPAVNNRD